MRGAALRTEESSLRLIKERRQFSFPNSFMHILLSYRGGTRPIPRCVRLTCQTGPVRLHRLRIQLERPLKNFSCASSQWDTWNWWPPFRTGELRQCATSAPSNAWRPADNYASVSALRTLLLMSSRPDLHDARTFASTRALAHSLLTSIKRCHCPVVNMLIRVCTFRCKILPPRGRAKSERFFRASPVPSPSPQRVTSVARPPRRDLDGTCRCLCNWN